MLDDVTEATPVFIIGVWKRSGTNFVAELLALHPLFQLPKPLWEDALLRSSHHLEEYVDRHIAGWSYWIQQEQGDPETLRRQFLQHIGYGVLSFLQAQVEPGKRLLCKTPYTDNLERFPQLFPHAKLVLLMRDGRDVVESSQRTWSHRSHRHFMKKWSAGARQLLDFIHGVGQSVSHQWILMKYEDLLNDPSTLRRLIEFLGVAEHEFPWDKVSSLQVKGSSGNRDDSGQVHWQPVPRAAGFQPIGRWQSWGRWRRRQFKRIAGRELIDCGYVQANDW